MHPTTLLILTTALLTPLITAFAPATCIPSTNGYSVADAITHYTTFCTHLSTTSFNSNSSSFADEVLYGDSLSSGIISLAFNTSSTTPNTNITSCSLSSCLSDFSSLIQSCELNSHSIWGTGSLESACGSYNYSLNWNHTSSSSSSTTPSTTPSSTVSTTTGKPTVGSTALGTSAATREIVWGSGYAMLGLACVVGWLL